LSARFVVNYVILLLGAAVLVFLYAFGRPVVSWVALGAGAAAIVCALVSFASVQQGVFQRIADLFIALVGTWSIVAARVLNGTGTWYLFGAGAGLLGLGAIGLIVREIELAGGLQVGDSRIGPDEFARLAALQGKAQARR
jgi:hypothetical protein